MRVDATTTRQKQNTTKEETKPSSLPLQPQTPHMLPPLPFPFLSLTTPPLSTPKSSSKARARARFPPSGLGARQATNQAAKKSSRLKLSPVSVYTPRREPYSLHPSVLLCPMQPASQPASGSACFGGRRKQASEHNRTILPRASGRLGVGVHAADGVLL